MSKMQVKIVRTTHADLSSTYTVKCRVKTRWYQLWSDWTTDSSHCHKYEAEEALEALTSSWQQPFVPSVSEDVSFVEVSRQ